MKAKPFLKWAGGKTQLLPQFEGFYPSILKKRRVRSYFEPFVGSGAVFFDLMSRYDFESAYISDLNNDLILCYKTIKTQVEDLLEVLRTFQMQFDSKNQEERADLFLEVRSNFNEQKHGFDYSSSNYLWLQRASQFIFLNKTCFNGLFRLNSKGGFNVPYGGYETAKIHDAGNLRAVNRLLQQTEIFCADYSACLEKVDDKSFVYLDPPYRPLNKTSSFTSYVGNVFADSEQQRLARFVKKLSLEKGASLMISNSDPKNIDPNDSFFDDLYEGFYLNRVSANRMINSKGANRGVISELLITNYQHEPQQQILAFDF